MCRDCGNPKIKAGDKHCQDRTVPIAFMGESRWQEMLGAISTYAKAVKDKVFFVTALGSK